MPRQEVRRHAATVLTIIAVALGYYAAAQVGLLLAVVRDQVTPLWPPTGIALVALLIWGVRLWPGIALGALLVNRPIGPSFPVVVLIAAGNTLAPVAAYLLLRRFGFQPEMNRLRDGLALIFWGGLAVLLSATTGSLALTVAGAVPSGDFWSTWSVWWTGDAMGLLVVAPLLLAVRAAPWPPSLTALRWLEAGALVLGCTAAAVVASRAPGSLMFLVFPFLIWAALRFQLLGATTCGLIVSVVAITAARNSAGPFTGLGVVSAMGHLQAFNVTVALTALLLSVMIAERNRAHHAIERACEQLIAALAQQHPAGASLRSLLPQRDDEPLPRDRESRDADPAPHGGTPLDRR